MAISGGAESNLQEEPELQVLSPGIHSKEHPSALTELTLPPFT